MMNFQVGLCDLKMKKDTLETFTKNNYLRFYKKDKLRHITRGDKRIPKLKITDDIFSLQIWFKDKTQNEHRIFVDGSIQLDTLLIHTITVNKFTFNEFEYNIFIDILKGLSKHADGYILISTDGVPQRISNGHMQKYEHLLEEMFQNIPEDKRDKMEELYKWMLETKKED